MANHQRRAKRHLIPTPAMAGALVLVVAGVGSVAFSSRTDGGNLAANYQTISANYTGEAASGDAGTVDISRDFDRDLLEKQANDQAAQRAKALQADASKVQKRADEIKINQWVIPVAGYRISARFGQRSSLWSTVHTGIDLSGPSGTTIVSIAGGTVKSTGYEGAYGNRTVITLNDGTDIWYCHQSRIVVQPGDKVEPGQTVGFTGSTGNVTGPHLHLEVRPGGGGPVDPYAALVEHGVQP